MINFVKKLYKNISFVLYLNSINVNGCDTVKKFGRYYVLIFIAALIAGLTVHDLKESKFTIIRSSEAYAPSETQTRAQNTSEDGKININTAPEKLLKTLDGIGDKMAERIIEYREENGEFETIEDIMKVSGIGQETFEKMKDYITVE